MDSRNCFCWLINWGSRSKWACFHFRWLIFCHCSNRSVVSSLCRILWRLSSPLLLFLAEVQIKVQVFDNSDLSPLASAQVEVHGNQTVLASSRAGGDGVLRVSFLYRTGTWVVITASKQDYVTNSVPWHSSRIPCESRKLILMTLSASEVLHQHSLRIIMLDIKCLTVSECHTSKLGLLWL